MPIQKQVVREFSDTHFYDTWIRDNRQLIAFAWRAIWGPAQWTREHKSLRKLQQIRSEFKRHEFSLQRLPKVAANYGVADGNHRIAYCLAAGVSCSVEYYDDIQEIRAGAL